MKNNKEKIVIYQGKNGEIALKGDVKEETIWASLQQIADLFETDKSGISHHIKNIYQSGELKQKATVAKIATVQTEGKRKNNRADFAVTKTIIMTEQNTRKIWIK